MDLVPGTRLGVYVVRSLLGVGGMGEVYLAHDGRLDRDVAIKVLPRSLTGSEDRLARFEREARALATLNHPNIATIYGLEELEGIRAIVMELVEGETLADKLQRTGGVASRGRRALSLDESIGIARQIADALDTAHEKGIIHRDLKPSNMKVSAAGVVKVLDFGLAKAAADGSGANLTDSPTVMGTSLGVILGTAPYMSPEQARGHVVDKRTDIWAFGCVLFEMLSGTPAFQRSTASDTIAAILERDRTGRRYPGQPPRTSPRSSIGVSRRIRGGGCATLATCDI